MTALLSDFEIEKAFTIAYSTVSKPSGLHMQFAHEIEQLVCNIFAHAALKLAFPNLVLQ